MDATTASLAGVIVGGLITTASNWVLAVRRERADAETDRRNRAIEVRRAARMISIELFVAATAARICVEKRHWWSADVPLKTEQWEK